MARKSHIRTIALIGVALLFVIAGLLTATQRRQEPVSVDSLLDIWADLSRDVDRFGLTITRLSTAREMEIGRAIAREIESRTRPSADRTWTGYVARVGEIVAAGAQRTGIIYTFNIIDSPEINAYAVAGGNIYVTTGMLDFLDSEAELAAVLGHEITHVDLKHCIENLQYELALERVVGDDLATIASVGYTLFRLGFSEQQELEADVAGMILAAKAGYEPRASITLMERLAEAEKLRGRRRADPGTIIGETAGALVEALVQYFETHPPAELRIRELEHALKRNALAWRDERFYVGEENHRARRSRPDIAYPGEWRTFEAE